MSLVLFNAVLLLVFELFACIKLPLITFRGNGFGLITSTVYIIFFILNCCCCCVEIIGMHKQTDTHTHKKCLIRQNEWNKIHRKYRWLNIC